MSLLSELCKDAINTIKDNEGLYTEDKLLDALNPIVRKDMNKREIRNSLIQVALELTTDMEPNWQYVAARAYTYEFMIELEV